MEVIALSISARDESFIVDILFQWWDARSRFQIIPEFFQFNDNSN